MIITNEKDLRMVCEPVLPEEVDDLRLRLDEALKWSARKGQPGIGLACPQIGIPKQMAIVRINKKLNFDLVNATIEKSYDLFTFDGEGCLSFPGRYEKTKRYREVVISNNMVWPYKFIVTDLAAIVVQHELDHLRQVLLPDVALK